MNIIKITIKYLCTTHIDAQTLRYSKIKLKLKAKIKGK